ncbi:hypothetical protein D1007_37865 [Hordeum vulgare]|nr:hypothetical protein D1007_37865 [Hordeum vulgare]KAI4964176.1 hypothetical protein ZWY2020_006942 [Hordeum vulgare]KAI4990245.1 hypothetical protein ZWY2020_038608 [Hordeum vulgare]
MATRAASLALCALLALSLVSLAVSRADPEGVAVQGFPCDNVVTIRMPHDGICQRDYCGGLCVQQFMWKYPGIKAVVGDCTGENTHECVCSFLC